MTQHEHDYDSHQGSSTGKWVLIGFLAIGGFFLIIEHRAHLFGWFPYLLLLACPLMHVFMHRGHGGHSHRHEQARDVNSTEAPTGHETHQSEERKGGQP